MKKLILSIFLALITWQVMPQALDSTFAEKIKVCQTDSCKIIVYNEICEFYINSNPKLSERFADSAIYLAAKTNNLIGEATALRRKAIMIKDRGQIDLALQYLQLAKIKFARAKDTLGIVKCLGNMGITFETQGKLPEALQHYQIAYNLAEKMSNKPMLATCLGNMANIYSTMEDYKQAIIYNEKSLVLRQQLNDKPGIASCFGNLGLIYKSTNDIPNAILKHNKALQIAKDIGDKWLQSIANNNLGELYNMARKYDLALKHNQLAYSLALAVQNTRSSAYALFGIAHALFMLNKPNEALVHALKAYKISQSLGDNKLLMSISELIANIYGNKGDYTKAFYYQSAHIALHDSLMNENVVRKITNQRNQFEFEKKHQQSLLEREKQKNEFLKRIEHEKQRHNWYIVGIFLMWLVLVFILYNSRLRRKANVLLTQKNLEISQHKEEIEAQRDEILLMNDELRKHQREVVRQRDALQNKANEIMGSILYASQIQAAIQNSAESLLNLTSEYFLIYKPHSIVSGDFFWVRRFDNKLVVAVADCTGHGVPGAFMSILGVAFLNEIIAYQKVLDPAKALSLLRQKVKNALNQDLKSMASNDGMDIGLLVIDMLTNQLEYSGAYHTLFVAKPGDEGQNELIELKGNRLPIGKHPFDLHDFSVKTLEIKPDYVFYMLSDGYYSQFGGVKNEKFSKNRLRALIKENSGLPLASQKEIWAKTFSNWKGKHEQIDDVLVLAFKPPVFFETK
jgi:serine phosphatase RsbU (regulator of sigma subunit)